MEFREVYERYKPELNRVEEILGEAVQSRNEDLTASSLQLLRAGGKRIRPLFAILCSRFGPNRGDEVYRLAAALELIHMATLVHDDVIDDADLRRGQPTVRSRYGNLPAMYTGDFLFARAIGLLASIGRRDVHMELSRAIVRMCEGEIEQIQDFYNWQQSIRHYLRRVERKTALLISVSCSLGATVAGADASTVMRLRRFGHLTGMAFQITDDVLDFVGETAVVGKPVGGDLRQGNLTLPALRASVRSERGEELRGLIRHGMDGSDVARAVEIVRDSDALAFARGVADLYLEKSIMELERLGPRQECEELRVIARFINQRTY